MQNAINNGRYTAEQNAGKIFPFQVSGTVPFYRLYSAALTDHFYTKEKWENDWAISNSGYTSEGIVGYVYLDATCGGVPFYRLFHSAPATDHFYTTADWEVKFAEGGGYLYEKIAAYVLPA